MKTIKNQNSPILLFVIFLLANAASIKAQNCGWAFEDNPHILNNNQYYDRAQLFQIKAAIVKSETYKFKGVQQQKVILSELNKLFSGNGCFGFRIVFGVLVNGNEAQMKYYLIPITFSTPTITTPISTNILNPIALNNPTYDNNVYGNTTIIYEFTPNGKLAPISDITQFNANIILYEKSFALLDGLSDTYLDRTEYNSDINKFYGSLSVVMPLEVVSNMCNDNAVDVFYFVSGISYNDNSQQVHSIEFSYLPINNKNANLVKPPFAGLSANFSQLCPTKCNSLNLQDVSPQTAPRTLYSIIK